jgi:hypothetical protein
MPAVDGTRAPLRPVGGRRATGAGILRSPTTRRSRSRSVHPWMVHTSRTGAMGRISGRATGAGRAGHASQGRPSPSSSSSECSVRQPPGGFGRAATRPTPPAARPPRKQIPRPPCPMPRLRHRALARPRQPLRLRAARRHLSPRPPRRPSQPTQHPVRRRPPTHRQTTSTRVRPAHPRVRRRSWATGRRCSAPRRSVMVPRSASRDGGELPAESLGLVRRSLTR